ncbi:putative acyltransferase [Terriglobus roseus DSM 18391]|uniref:Putative acyltransferase n=1 Tax=Terriglobus roseus (strain DSM 18391 / NRRL B-41598 / KBS 63) TaxID=926566 RepID=I3ZI14_TERRK|nr:acyltransferase [Terriglobus roseus]AFL88543.1 putative acyltransferase [Terriglobus roseus DSM 18391]AFL88882.1 putative acyltransferase [Terriglobus roseus DSM 18391]
MKVVAAAGSRGLIQPAPSLRSTVLTVQALRGIAALLVISLHTTTMWFELGRRTLPFIVNGGTGLDIFFVLSGFIMPLSVRRSNSGPADARRFLLRRLERLVPAYWIFTTLKLLKDFFLPGTVKLAVWHTIASYLFLPSRNSLGEVVPLLPPGWTLNMEMLFYLLIALALLFRVRLRYFLPPLLMLGAAGFFLHLPALVPVDTARLPLLLEFLLGMVLAERYRAVALRGAMPCPAWIACAGMLLSTWLMVFTQWGAISYFVFAGPLAFLMVGFAVELERSIGRRIPRLLLLIGDASYSIYLVHWFLVGAVRSIIQLPAFSGVQNFMVPLGLTMALSIVCGIACYHWIESPINRHFHVRRRAATAA